MRGQEKELKRELCRAGEAEIGQNGSAEQKNISHFGLRAADVTADKQEVWKLQRMITTNTGYRRMCSLIWHLTHAGDRERHGSLDVQTHFS